MGDTLGLTREEVEAGGHLWFDRNADDLSTVRK